MTAIAAAIIELKAHCEHTWEVIRALERFGKVVEDAHEKASGAVDAVCLEATLGGKPLPTGTRVNVSTTARAPRGTRRAKAKARKMAAPATPKAPGKTHRQGVPSKPNGKPAPKTSSGPSTGFSVGAAIIHALGAASAPMSPLDVIRVTKLPRWRVMRALLDMHASGQIAKIGQHHGAKYALLSAPRPGAAAGTQAAPPAGPSSASGSPPKSDTGNFEVAWSGTKERNGTAPTITGPRERRP